MEVIFQIALVILHCMMFIPLHFNYCMGGFLGDIDDLWMKHFGYSLIL
jgi:hypothetical protein